MSEALTYYKPADSAVAKTLYHEADEARYLAGGMTLLPTMRQRLVAPDAMIDLALAVGDDIAIEGGMLVIGAMATHHKVATSQIVQTYLPALADLAGGIGDRQVRVRGTIGGSVANNDPAACYPAGVLALGAVIITDRREIAASDYFVDLFETALEDGEIILKLRFVLPLKAAYVKAPNPASRYALVGVFVAQFEIGETASKTGGVTVGVTGAGENGVFRWQKAEARLADNFAPNSLAGLIASDEGLMGDIHAASDFRAYLMTTMAQKALKIATERE